MKRAKECLEGGDDDDIECIDFVYPMVVYSFDINLQQTGSVTVENDMQLRRYFSERGDDDLLSFDFPISLKLYDDTKISVNNNAELAKPLKLLKVNVMRMMITIFMMMTLPKSDWKNI